MSFQFPVDLAKRLAETWPSTQSVDYAPPPLPAAEQLRTILEVAYLAGMEKDEGRPVRFMLCCTPDVDSVARHRSKDEVESWAFAHNRLFTIQEIRRLAAVVDLDTAAIWVQFSKDPNGEPVIHGLVNLGSSWSRARYSFSYQYSPLPEAMLVRVSGPGRVSVYQAQTLLASLQSGRVTSGSTPHPAKLLGAYPLFQDGHRLLCGELGSAGEQEVPQWYDFAWKAYVNTVYAVVNSIRLQRHGGAIIFAGQDSRLVREEYVRIKYPLTPADLPLRHRFVEFISLYQQYAEARQDAVLQAQERRSEPDGSEARLIEFELQEAEQRLTDTCKFIGNLAGTDGAILLRTDLSVEGFGAEVLLTKVKPSRVYRVDDPRRNTREDFDSEQFGMRHRSAIRLSAVVSDLVVFAVSQDGGVSLVWNDQGQACLKTGLRTTDVSVVLP